MRRTVKPNLLDRAISWIDPERAYRRMRYRSAIASGGYDSAKRTRTSRDRNTEGGSGDDQLDHETLWTMRETGRDLFRNNGLFKGMVRTAARNIFGGNGYTLDARPEVVAYWEEWTKKGNADRRGKQSFWSMMRMAKTAEFVDGDHFFFIDPVGRTGLRSLMPIEGDRILTPQGSPQNIVHGIRMDSSGEPLAYWIANQMRRRHQRDSAAFGYARADQGRWFPAERIIHQVDWERGSHTRGVPVGSTMKTDLDDLDSILVSTRTTMRIAAMRGFAITKNDDAEGFAAEMRESGREDERGEERVEEMVNGEIVYLNSGESMQSVGSEHPNDNFLDFVYLVSRMVGLPMGFPLELVLLDFSKGNFSAARMAIEESRRVFRQHQVDAIDTVIDPTFNAVIDHGIREGRFEGVEAGTTEAESLFEHAWIPSGWPYIEPVKDRRADALALRTRTTSRKRIAARDGVPIAKIFDELEDEEKELERRGLQSDVPDVGELDGDENENSPDEPSSEADAEGIEAELESQNA